MLGRSIFRVFCLIAAVLTFAGGASANAPRISLLPVLRPAGPVAGAGFLPRRVLVPVFYNADIRPVLRPVTNATVSPAGSGQSDGGVLAATVVPVVVTEVAPEAVPEVRTETRAERRRRERAERRAARRARRDARRTPTTRTSYPRSGSVCSDRSIRGERISGISGNRNGCGISNPVRVTEIDGIRLSQPATINCDTARAVKSWLNEGVRPSVGRLGGGVESVRVIASYSCRTRNSRRGARISEHAKGNAVDIAAFTLANGTEIEVEDGWNNRTQRRVLRRIHNAACGTFGTVLGPDADRHHQDHFHLDIARHRGGAYCR